MRLKLVPITLLLLCLLGGTAFGSVVGKIVGQVTDGQTGEPVVGVSVSIQGTSMGGMTDADGYYRILNVPVGDYLLVMSAVGYTTVEVSNVHVSADLASYHDMELSKEAADLGTTIRVVAEQPLVVKDKTTTIDIVQRDELLAMPTRGFEEVVGIQNSVVRMNSGNFGQRQRGQRTATSNSTELNLRGGRPSEVAYYVDGFSQQDPLTGVSSARINNNAIKEVSVQSGAFSAEYGHVASGVVNVVTNSGTDEYHGNVEVVTDNVTNKSYDHNYYSADIGGPIPGIEGATFFFSGERRFLRDRTPSPKTEEMHETYGAPFGLDTLFSDNPQRLPGNHVNGWSYQGKIDYQINPNLKLALMGNGSIDNWREYRQEWALNSLHGPRYKDENMGLNAKITHTLNANTFYNLSASFFETKRLRGDNVIWEDYEAYNKDYSNPEYEPTNLFWTNSEQRINEVTNDTLLTPSWYAGFQRRVSSYIGVKGDMTSQVNERNTLKVGFDFQRHTLRFFQNFDASKDFDYGMTNYYGYDSVGNETDTDDFRFSKKHPINLGVYVQDRFEWQGLVVNAGLRFDYFDYKAKRLKNLQNPFDPDGDEDALSGVLDEDDVEDSEKFSRLSPRLGISFPVSEKTQMHINYGKFFQRPDLVRLYVGYQFFEARVTEGSYAPIGSPNLEPEKTTQYEVGVTHQLSDNMVFNLTAYYKDVQDLTQIFHQSPAVPNVYDYYSNTDFGTIKGVDFGLTMRRTRNIRFDLNYSLSYATGTGSYANTQYVIAWQNPDDPPKSTHPLDYDQRHSLSGVFDFRLGAQEGPRVGDYYPLENFGLNILATAGSGTPYTPMGVYDEATEAAVNPKPDGEINSARKPWTYSVDLKMERRFKYANFDFVPYIWVRNLFDTENVLGVYEGSGKATVTGYLETPPGQTSIVANADQQYKEKYELKQFNPTNYANPRMIMAGLRVSF